MRKTIYAASFAALLGLGGAACAADVYSGGGGMKDAPVPVEVSTWTGFYIGVGGGGGAVNHDLTAKQTYQNTESVRMSSISSSSSGVELNGIGGEGGYGTVEAGYDKQYGRFVGGIFFNYDFTDISSNLKLFGTTVSYDLDDLWSAGGRVGYLVNPETLAYVLGAYTQASFSASKNLGIGDRDYSGFTVGGGLETKLSNNWSLKAEYRFTSLDTETLFNSYGLKITDDADIHQGRIVLAYKLNPLGGTDYAPMK